MEIVVIFLNCCNFQDGQEGLANRRIFEQSLEERKRIRHALIWGKNIPIRRKSKCKSPEVRTCLLSMFKNSKETRGGRVVRVRIIRLLMRIDRYQEVHRSCKAL